MHETEDKLRGWWPVSCPNFQTRRRIPSCCSITTVFFENFQPSSFRKNAKCSTGKGQKEEFQKFLSKKPFQAAQKLDYYYRGTSIFHKSTSSTSYSGTN